MTALLLLVTIRLTGRQCFASSRPSGPAIKKGVYFTSARFLNSSCLKLYIPSEDKHMLTCIGYYCMLHVTLIGQGRIKRQVFSVLICLKVCERSWSILLFQFGQEENFTLTELLSPIPTWLLCCASVHPWSPETCWNCFKSGRVAMTKHANISAHATNCLACRAGGGGGERVEAGVAGSRSHCLLTWGTLPVI